MNKDNPWTKKARKVTRHPKARSTGSPWSRRGRSSTSTSISLKHGDRVRCQWQIDPAFGIGPGKFVGTVTDVRGRDFATVTNRNGQLLDVYLPSKRMEVTVL